MLAATIVLAGSGQARAGLFINLNFDSSFAASFGANTAAAEAAAQYAAQQYDNLFTNPITLNITVAGVSGTSVFGESDSTYGPDTFQSYTAIRNALTADANSSQNPTSILRRTVLKARLWAYSLAVAVTAPLPLAPGTPGPSTRITGLWLANTILLALSSTRSRKSWVALEKQEERDPATARVFSRQSTSPALTGGLVVRAIRATVTISPSTMA
jgi:hypothetical protein